MMKCDLHWRVQQCLLLLIITSTYALKRPNIVFILGDDMGWNDVSYHGMNEILTPNLATLAGAGLILNNYYVQPLCTPSRGSFLTGKYPIHTGLSHLPFIEGQPSGLSLNFTLLPQYLKNLGYKTHMLGKWHLGFRNKEYTPVYRGFDTHYGYWGGVVDYFQHTSTASATASVGSQGVINLPTNYGNSTVFFVGYDFHENMNPVEGDTQEYMVDLLTKRAVDIIYNHDTRQPMFMYLAQIAVHAPPDDIPVKSPKKYHDRFYYIKDSLRKNFAGDLTALDECVGSVLEALYEAKMLDNTIFIFSSDNGADIGFFPNGGSNYPLRGSKGSVFEGGIKANGIVWSPLIKNLPRISNEMMHMTDWLPSLYQAAGGSLTDIQDIDGVNQWPMISQGAAGQRKDLLINIDPIGNVSSYRDERFKVVLGRSTVNIDNWYGPTGRDAMNLGVPYNNKVQRVLQKYYRQWNGEWIPRLSPLNCSSPPNVPKDQCLHSPCLFDLSVDPCEHNDISGSNPQKLQELLTKMDKYRKTVVQPAPIVLDYNADPLKHCGLWTPWLDPEQNNINCCGRITFN